MPDAPTSMHALTKLARLSATVERPSLTFSGSSFRCSVAFHTLIPSPFSKGLKTVVMMGASFEAQMSKVESFAGEAHNQIASLSAGVLDISRNTGEAANSVAQGLYYVESAGFHGADAMHAWKTDPEFRQRMAAVQQHVAEFSPTEFELVAEV